jgi:hypothetical protein
MQVCNSVSNKEELAGTPFTDESNETMQNQITFLRAYGCRSAGREVHSDTDTASGASQCRIIIRRDDRRIRFACDLAWDTF